MIRLSSHISLDQLSWRNHPSINTWTRQNGLITSADMARWLKKIDEDPTILMFGIEAKVDGIKIHDYGNTLRGWQNIGTCGLTSISYIHGHAEFSLLINPDFHHHGFGTEALKELIRYAFKNLRLQYIWGETFAENPARKVFEKIGFKEEGKHLSKYFKDGSYIDSVTYAIRHKEAAIQCPWFWDKSSST